ncbi:hypothetical protein ATJ97_2741 [Georgenia soli]|uniref:Uncharacterized protein n=1 Tax=Georgenia soli TaxID=638953 RepID=A0A2A9EPP6_9MICO|nr:hypothetical protein [Georgenia soli]PFG40220.1 hypothetical protein ATJ97_2741 [Georgenia soli]
MSSPNPDEAVGMSDEPEQAQSTRGSTPEGKAPNPETGVGLGAGEPNTFEPEEDPEA